MEILAKHYYLRYIGIDWKYLKRNINIAKLFIVWNIYAAILKKCKHPGVGELFQFNIANTLQNIATKKNCLCAKYTKIYFT